MQAAKAYVAAVIAALTAVLSEADSLPTWLVIVIGAIVAGLATFTIPNKPAPKRRG